METGSDQISRKVLFVDDEMNVLQAIRRQLRGKFDVSIAQGGEIALRTIREQGPFAVIVSDHNMPGMTGVTLLQQIHAQWPDSVLVMLTGRGDLDTVIAALHDAHIFRFLNKPCPAESLVATLNDCIAQYRLVMSERLLKAELNRANEELRGLNEDLERRVAERTASLRRLHQFMSDLNGLDGMEAVARVIVDTVADVLRSRRVSLMVPDGSREYLRILAASGLPDDVVKRVRVPVGQSVSGVVFSEGTSIVANQEGDLQGRDSRYETDLFVSCPLVCASLSTPARAVGVLNVTEPAEGRPYDQEAIASLNAIAEASAIALVNQFRLQERNEARDATIMALAKLAEHRDPETGAHLERVQTYCRALSETMSRTQAYKNIIDEEFVDDIVRSSPLHDIGKVGIPDGILQKRGRLTPEEFEIMRQHTWIGGETIKDLIRHLRRPSFLHMGMQIAYAHHEKYDGSGYPLGLKGDDIPLPARILALADVYDAITSRRCYKEPMPHETAAQVIAEGNGSHFHPDVVAAFFSCESLFKTICVALADPEDGAKAARPAPKSLSPDAAPARAN